MKQTTNRTDAQRAIAELMAVHEFRQGQAKAYVDGLTYDQLNIALRHHGCAEVSELIDEITRGLMQRDITRPNGW